MIRRKKHGLCPEWVQIKMLFPAKQNLFENMHYDKIKKMGIFEIQKGGGI